MCPSCKKSFNIENVDEDDYCMPPMLPAHGDPTCCDTCRTAQGDFARLVARKDDNLEVIKHRQRIYQAEVQDVLGFYDEQGVLCSFEPKKGVADYP